MSGMRRGQNANGAGIGQKLLERIHACQKSMSVVSVNWRKDGDYDNLES